MKTEPIKRKLSEEVRVRLEELIREEVYPVGSSLPPEREIMEMFGVGRPSVREALYSLERMGLLRLGTGERPKVTRPTPELMLSSLSGVAGLLLDTPEGVQNFEQVRMFMETSIVRHLAESASDEDIDRLRGALERSESSLPKARGFAITDVAFHRTLAELTGNPIFVAVHDALVNWLISQRSLPKDPQTSNRASYEGHVAVFAAIEARNPDAAAAAMQLHLEDAHAKFS